MSLRTFMIWANLLVAFDYFIIAIYWTQHLRVPLRLRHRNPESSMGSIVVVLAAVLFFVGCSHTHLDLVFALRSDEYWSHWTSPLNVISHVVQAVGGLVFALGATYWIHVRIFDRKQYDTVIARARESSEYVMNESERELREARDRLALMEQVVRLRQSDVPPEPGKDRRRRPSDGDDA